MARRTAAAVAELDDQLPAVRPDWGKPLDTREYLFVQAYMGDFNGTRAMMLAVPGLGAKSASVMAVQMKARPHVRAAIETLLREKMPAIKLGLIERMTAVALQRPEDYYRWGERKTKETVSTGTTADLKPIVKTREVMVPTVSLTPSRKLDQRQMAAVKGVRKRIGVHGTTIELLLHDPLIAAEKLAALLGFTREDDARGVGGGVNFVFEFPDGTTASLKSAQPSVIDHAAVQAEIAKNAEVAEELPPGAKRLVIETP